MNAGIIIVDDTPENLTVLRDMLTHAGYRVRPVLSGELALKIARKEPPDLILLDVLMPGLNGYQTCERLKADPLTADCPVLFISALDGTADKVRGFEAGGLDYITKPFRQEEVLARVRTHLALRAAQRTLKEQNVELVTAAALREDVDRILRHDLRGPLGNIIAFSELIIEATHQSGGLLADHAKIINGAAYATLSMIHGSFDLIKMERGSYVAQKEAFDLRELLRQVLLEMGLLARHKRLALSVSGNGNGNGNDNDNDNATVIGERLLTRSLFYNLIKNAIEASPAGGNVDLSLSPTADGRAIEVRARNAGAVPEAIRERFFDKYVTAGKEGGSGLGTYSARLMAQAQGGSIRVDCGEAGHTTVVVTLPAAMDGAAPITGAGDDAASERSGFRILIADDDAANRAYLARVLAPARIHEAADGAQALGLLAEHVFDIAVLDLNMPGLGGLAVATRYLGRDGGAAPPLPRVRLIALTGHRDDATRQACLDAGFDRVLTKPPGRAQLCDTLRQVLDEHAPWAEVERDLAPLMPDFMHTRRAELDRLADAIGQGDHAAIVSLAHRLQGSLGMYGLADASQLATTIEKAGVADLAQSARLLGALDRHLTQLRIRYV